MFNVQDLKSFLSNYLALYFQTHTHTHSKKKKKNKEKESFETYQIQCFVQGRRKNEPINFLLPVLTHLYYLFKNN